MFWKLVFPKNNIFFILAFFWFDCGNSNTIVTDATTSTAIKRIGSIISELEWVYSHQKSCSYCSNYFISMLVQSDILWTGWHVNILYFVVSHLISIIEVRQEYFCVLESTYLYQGFFQAFFTAGKQCQKTRFKLSFKNSICS